MVEREVNAMPDPHIEHTVCAAINEIVVTVNELLEKRRTFTALIILYSGIDIFGSLLRPKVNLDTSGVDFKNWTERYLLNGSSLPVNANDLWSARCGLLHTDTPSSRGSRSGSAREILPFRGDEQVAIPAQQVFQRAGKQVVLLNVDDLFNAFSSGVMKFIQDIHSDATARDTVFHHAAAIFLLPQL